MRTNLNRWLATGLTAIVLLFGVAAGLTLYAYSRSHPDVVIPEENRDTFARVAILMDGTDSMGGNASFAMIKDIMEKKILPGLGLDDIAIAYDVQPTFGTENHVFGLHDDQMPQTQESRSEILATLRRNQKSSRKGLVDDATYDLIRKVASGRDKVEGNRKAWIEQVQARKAPRSKGSDICHPLQDISEFLARQDPDRKKWLFLLTDLHDTRMASCPAVQPFQADAHILLIHPPFDPSDPAGKGVERFSRTLFGERKLDKLSFSSALVDGALLPPNPTASLDLYEIPTFWGVALPLLLPGLLLISVPTLVIDRIFSRVQRAPTQKERKEEPGTGAAAR